MLDVDSIHLFIAEPLVPMRIAYQSLFEKEGFKVILAENPIYFFSHLTRDTFDFVFLDPAFFGQDATSQLKKVAGQFPGKRVIVATSACNPDWEKVAEENDFAEYIAKGTVSPKNLVTRVEELVDFILSQEEME